ncbi:MAG: carnitine 3-dehydrogenase [Alphaproteobacteria bacterium]|nr:carnitine 3-dehydrogenase [Alphaproteobacteria bacterium]
MNDTAEIRTIGLLGGGLIGGGWAARAVLNGLDAVVCDPDPEAERKLDETLENARRAYATLTIAPLPKPGTWRIVRRPEAAAEAADLLQESLPEREDLKIALLAQAEAALRDGVIIASSTSGLLPSRLQSGLRDPSRFLVAHPFNPSYLMPLVELCGGARTSAATIERAAAFYRRLGMHPLPLRREIDGFLGNRMAQALWREAMWLLHDDVATVEEIDDALRFGPGLRWAIFGPFLTYRMAGGEAGMRHFLRQFGPSLQWPWTKFANVPELSEALSEKLVAQSDAQAGDASAHVLERQRDDCLVGILQALRANDCGAGRVFVEWERALWQSHPRRESDEAPLRAFSGRVEPGWIDYNGHMTESRYLHVFGHGSDALLAAIGAGPAYTAQGHSFYAVETHIMHLRELPQDARFYITTQILGADDKRLHIFQTLYRTDDDVAAATCEQMMLHVDMQAKRSCAMLPAVRTKLDRLATLHAALPRPVRAGRAIAMPA